MSFRGKEGKGSPTPLRAADVASVALLSHSDQYYGRLTAGPYFGGAFLSFSSLMLRDLLTGIP